MSQCSLTLPAALLQRAALEPKPETSNSLRISRSASVSRAATERPGPTHLLSA